MNSHPEETVGPNYDRAMMIEARRRTFDAIGKIAAAVKPGMRESEATALAKSILKELGLLRGWHGVYVRLGSNTLCTYNDKSAPDVVLAENDIFYIDIGPVWEKWEGDGGDRRCSFGGLSHPAVDDVRCSRGAGAGRSGCRRQ